MKNPLVRINGLNHHYQEGSNRHQILFDINTEIYSGEIVILTGPSGSGKTTLLTLIGALRSVQEGSLRVLNHELRNSDESTLVKVRQRIGYIFQSHNLLEALTARENVELVLHLQPSLTQDRMRARSEAALDAVGLGGRVDAHPNELSGGQRQRVAIARALVAAPELVLADEPTASLDKKSGRGVVEILQKLAKKDGVTVILVTHDNRILDIADRILTLEDGRLSSLMSAVTSSTQHMLGLLARDLRGGNLTSRMRGLNRDEFAEMMDEITSETQGLLDIVDLVQGATFRSVQEQVISAFTLKIGEFLNTEDTTLYFLDIDTRALWSFKQSSRSDFEEINVPPEQGIVGYVANTGNTVYTADAASLDQYDPLIDGESTRSLLCIPVLDSEGRIFAVVKLVNKRNQEAFNVDDEHQLRELTKTLALVLESWWRMGCSCRAAGIGRGASCCMPRGCTVLPG